MPTLHHTEPMRTKVNRKQVQGLLAQNHFLHSLISITHLQMIPTILQTYRNENIPKQFQCQNCSTMHI